MRRFNDSEPLDRRTFLGTLGVGLVGWKWAHEMGAVRDARRSIERLGVQLYTVRSLMERDVAGTLEAVAGIGYREVETAGLFGLAPARFRDLLDRAGLSSPAAHVPLDALREDLDAVLAAARALGQDRVIVPWLDQRERTGSGYRRVARELNGLGERAGERGLRVGYHNHDFEFGALEGGGTGYDILIGETDPALVDMELDLYWAVRGGRDPVALFERHPGRFPLCHVKDMKGRGSDARQAPVGEGTIDFARIFEHADRAGLRHYIVEEDDPVDPLASITTSYATLRGLLR